MAKLLSGRIKHSTLDQHIKLEETQPFLGVPDSDNAIAIFNVDGTSTFFNFDSSFTFDGATGTIGQTGAGEAGEAHDSEKTQAQIDSTLANDPLLGGLAHDSALTQGQIDSAFANTPLHDSALFRGQFDSQITTKSIGVLSNVNLTGIQHNKILKYDSNSGSFVVADDTAESADGGGGIDLTSLSVNDSGGFGFLTYNNVSGVFNFGGTESADITGVINSAYVQGIINQAYINTLDTHDSTAVSGQISDDVDSAFLTQRLTRGLLDDLNLVDSDAVVAIIDSAVDSAFVRPLARAAMVAGSNVTYDSASGVISVAAISPTGIDSAATEAFIDSAYIAPRARAALVGGTNVTYDSATGVISAALETGLDSAATSAFIDSAYVQLRVPQSYIDTLDTHDSARVVNQIEREVDSAFVQPFARSAIVAGQFIIYDSASGIIRATAAVDSALTIALIDSAHVQARVPQSYIDTLDTHDSNLVEQQIDSNIAALVVHDSARTQAQIDSNFNASSVFLRSDIDDIAEGNITFNNNAEARFGPGGSANHDFKIVHNSPEHKNFIQAGETDSINISANAILFGDKDSNNTIFKVAATGATELYHNKVKRAETTATGMSMDTLTATSSVTVGGNEVLTTATDLHDSVAVQGQIDSNFTNNTTFLRAAGDSVTGNLTFGDSVEAIFGDQNNLRMFHDGNVNQNFIKVNKDVTDNLYVATGTFGVVADEFDSTSFLVIENGKTQLYYAKAEVAETTATGMSMKQIQIDSALTLTAGANATIGSNRILTTGDEGSGNGLDADTLDSVQASSFLRSDQADIKTAGQLVLNDGIALKFGTDSDHSITETSGDLAVTTAGTTNLSLRTASLQVKNQANSETMLTASQNGAVRLYYDNGSKIQTTATGVNIDTQVTVDSAIVSAELTTADIILTASSQNVGASITTVDEFAHGGIPQSIEYTIHMKAVSGTGKGETEVTKVLATFDSGLLVGFTEFGAVHSGDSDFGDFTVDENGGNIRLRFTRRSSRDESIRIKPHKMIMS